MEKKKPNVVLYTIFMSIVFLVITELIIWGYGGRLITNAIMNSPQGSLVIHEIVIACMVLIVMLLFGNSYVFTQKSEKLTKGLRYCTFFIVGFGLFFLTGIGGAIKNPLAVLNVAIGCFFVGVAEEFLCRGWLLNEFLERFGKTRKGVWYSIIISGIIFGLIHLANILAGQSVAGTIVQVINAMGIGIVLGVIYYKTKNIWTCVMIHGLWDFAIFLSEISPVISKTESVESTSLLSVILTILMVGCEILSIYPLLKDIDSEPHQGKLVGLGFGCFFAYIVLLIINALTIVQDVTTYNYDNISLNRYSVITDNYIDYYMNYTKEEKEEYDFNGTIIENTTSEDYSFRYYIKDKNLFLENLKTNYSIKFDIDDLWDFIILEEKDYFVLAYNNYDKNTNSMLMYSFIKKDDISNSNEFLDNLKKNMKKYLLSERSELRIIYDRDNDISYVSAYEPDYGYYLLTEEDKMAILNRD